MYYATKRSNNTTRLVGLVAVVVMNALVFWALASGFGASMMAKLTETQVAIIEQPKEEEPPPPPPPPVDVDLPPPPPQVILPDFVFNQPPAPTAIQQVQVTPQPARPAEVRPAPPAPTLPPVRPSCVGTCSSKMADLMSQYYPEASRRAKEQGTVYVSMCVAIDGKISDVNLVKSSGFPKLDDATVKFLPKMRVTPAKDTSGKATAWCQPAYQMTVVWQLPKD